MQFLSKKIPTLAGIVVIVIVALIAGGVMVWQFLLSQNLLSPETSKIEDIKKSPKEMYQDWKKFGAKYLSDKEFNLVFPEPNQEYYNWRVDIEKEIDLDNDGEKEKIFWWYATGKLVKNPKNNVALAAGPPAESGDDVSGQNILFIYDSNNQFIDAYFMGRELTIHYSYEEPPTSYLMDYSTVRFMENINTDYPSGILIYYVSSGSGGYTDAILLSLKNKKLFALFASEILSGLNLEFKDLDNDGNKELIARFSFDGGGLPAKTETFWKDIFRWNGSEYEIANTSYPEEYRELVDYYQNFDADNCFKQTAIKLSQGVSADPRTDCFNY